MHADNAVLDSRMEVELIGAEEDNMGPRGVITDDCDIDEFGNSLIGEEKGILLEPRVGMEFDSEAAAKIFYEDYARRIGFSPRTHSNQSKTDGSVTHCEFSCSRKRSGESCEAMLRVEPRLGNKWVVVRFVKEHSHAILTRSKLHCLRPKRHFVPRGVMYASMDELHRTVKNAKRTLGRDAQNLLDYFQKMQAENPGFYYAIQLDEENRMTNAFWADARSRAAYRRFGDSVAFDSSYRVNRYKVPFTPFTGVNHHGQTIIFGCGLLLDESEATFVWLFKTFLAAMNERGPVSLTTDFNRSIHSAAMKVFPEARHCFNKWHVLREGQERMARVCLSHPNFQSELYNCINRTVTVEEFESFWQLIIEKYDLKGNDWLSSIHKARTQWVPVYFRDSFFAAFPNLDPESSFFDGYVNQETTLPLFFRQYERALENSFEREADADFDTMCTTPVLKTPSPMEKQAAASYTKWVFSRFQEELVETFVYTANRVAGEGHMSTYRVVKFENERKAYFVSLNISEMKANCTCKMFEYSGILCRHILTVFTVTNVLTLPSHYILNRWTKNAKNRPSFNHSELQGHESLTMRYNNLCKEGIKFAELGAATLETYNAALFSLREGGKKVGCVKNSVAELLPSRSSVSGVGYDDQRMSVGNPAMAPVLWPLQDEIIRGFNLNDVGVPCGPVFDSNVPRVGLVSLKRDGGHTDNMPVLPCLKSMTWVMENKILTPANRVAVINLKLQDYGKTPTGESEIKFSLSKVTLEPMLRSMAYISEQLSTPASKVAVINLKRQDTEITLGESEVKFQVSKDTLGAMLRSMAYIREQLSNTVELKQNNTVKRLRK